MRRPCAPWTGRTLGAQMPAFVSPRTFLDALVLRMLQEPSSRLDALSCENTTPPAACGCGAGAVWWRVRASVHLGGGRAAAGGGTDPGAVPGGQPRNRALAELRGRLRRLPPRRKVRVDDRCGWWEWSGLRGGRSRGSGAHLAAHGGRAARREGLLAAGSVPEPSHAGAFRARRIRDERAGERDRRRRWRCDAGRQLHGWTPTFTMQVTGFMPEASVGGQRFTFTPVSAMVASVKPAPPLHHPHRRQSLNAEEAEWSPCR